MHTCIAFRCDTQMTDYILIWHIHILIFRWHILYSDHIFRFTLIFMWHIKLCFHIQMAYSDGLFKCMFVSHSHGIFHIAYSIFIFIWHMGLLQAVLPLPSSLRFKVSAQSAVVSLKKYLGSLLTLLSFVSIARLKP